MKLKTKIDLCLNDMVTLYGVKCHKHNYGFLYDKLFIALPKIAFFYERCSIDICWRPKNAIQVAHILDYMDADHN